MVRKTTSYEDSSLSPRVPGAESVPPAVGPRQSVVMGTEPVHRRPSNASASSVSFPLDPSGSRVSLISTGSASSEASSNGSGRTENLSNCQWWVATQIILFLTKVTNQIDLLNMTTNQIALLIRSTNRCIAERCMCVKVGLLCHCDDLLIVVMLSPTCMYSVYH